MARVWFYGKVIDNQDPLNLGRIRAKILTDDVEAIIKSVEDYNPLTDSWSEKDPLVFNSFLPLYIYAVPKVDELIQIFYHDPESSQFLNAYYIQGPFSKIQNIGLENYLQSQRYGDIQGIRQKTSKYFKNPDGTYKSSIPEGVFPNPGDVSIMGRGSTDLVLKEDEVLLRAGKFQGSLMPNSDPVGNQNRAFIQLSKFNYQKTLKPNQKYFEIKTNNPQVKFLIEYNISNPENQFNIFNGTCRLYRLIAAPATLANSLKVDSNIDTYKILVAQETFSITGVAETVNFINDFIKTCNSKRKTASGIELFGPLEERFPIYFRPSNFNYSLLQSDNQVTKQNLTSIYQNIKLNRNDDKGGYGLIYEKNKTGQPIDLIKKVVNEVSTNAVPTTYASLGANEIYLLSQKSQIPGKQKINFKNNLYGITETEFTESIRPNTSSLVRGEELLEYLSYIVRFLVTHTHAYPGESPISITEDGASIPQLTSLQNQAYQKVLNQNIRLN